MRATRCSTRRALWCPVSSAAVALVMRVRHSVLAACEWVRIGVPSGQLWSLSGLYAGVRSWSAVPTAVWLLRHCALRATVGGAKYAKRSSRAACPARSINNQHPAHSAGSGRPMLTASVVRASVATARCRLGLPSSDDSRRRESGV
eukprot:5275688-Prymnesium_polylepis.1